MSEGDYAVRWIKRAVIAIVIGLVLLGIAIGKWIL